jgi:outer membrane protein
MIAASFRLSLMFTVGTAAFFLVFGTSIKAETLSLKDAQRIAIKNNPKISAANLEALMAKQTVRESRSTLFPTINADATAVGTPNDRNNILSAGSLQVSSSYSRQADGISVNQLITDFGRTANSVASSKLGAQAQEQGASATHEQIILAVNVAYFDALQAQSVLEVARQTVDTRQTVDNQVQEMASNNLRSDIDVSFADVNLEDSKLLLADAENNLHAAFARLSYLLGERDQKSYELQQSSLPPLPSTNDWELVATALRNRPDLAQFRLQHESAKKFARAERALNYPTINAFGAAGTLPIHSDGLNNDYAAAGVNLRLTIFEGFLYSARKKKADLSADVASEKLRDAENEVIRDVRVANMDRTYALKRLELTEKLLVSANKAYDLAQQRYEVGSSSIVELSQAQLNQTEAKIGRAKAVFELQVRNAVLAYQIGDITTPP